MTELAVHGFADFSETIDSGRMHTVVTESAKPNPLCLEDLLDADWLDDIAALQETSDDTHQPYVLGETILKQAVLIRAASEMLFEGCSAEAASFVDDKFMYLKKELADVSQHYTGGTANPEQAGVRFLRRLGDQYKIFLAAARYRQPELDQARGAFIDRMHYAIEHQGLPLSHEQLEARLEGVKLGFGHTLNHKRHNVASYNPISRRALVTIGRHQDAVEPDVFHELMHAVSTVRIRDKLGTLVVHQLGLEFFGKQDGGAGVGRLWLNEAVTDMLVNILLDKDGYEWDFGNQQTPLLRSQPDDGHLVAHMPLARSGEDIYAQHKIAMLNATMAVPTKTLLAAYFAQNDDPYVQDQRAGTHAERDLQRVLKQTGGKQRIAQLRTIDRQFGKASRNILTEQSSVRYALSVSGDIAEQGEVGWPTSAIQDWTYSRAYQRTTDTRRAQIERAKSWVASRGNIC